MQVKAYADGSFNAGTGVYGSGLVIILPTGEVREFSFSDNDKDLAKMRNVAGEIRAALIALDFAQKYDDCSELIIYYDYDGIEKWVTGRWQAKNQWTQMYRNMMKSATVQLSFRKVTAHTGDFYNELADRLAKRGAGI